MKNPKILSLSLFTFLIVVIGFTSCEDSDDNALQDSIITLTVDEKADLQFMREEEKLARDVYLYLYENHELNIFKNIASSEQTHMDAVLAIMEKYGVEDPASIELGVFTDNALQQLYDDLIIQGETSLVNALAVGATIEDVDIRDLGGAIAFTSRTDIIEMYEMLKCGSRNHMRAFTSQLNIQGDTYTPQFITMEEYGEIINGEHEFCGL